MKKLILLIGIIIPCISLCQIVPFEVEFVNTGPEWIYVTTDTNYITSNPSLAFASIFSNRRNIWTDDVDDKLLIFEQNAGPINGNSGYSLFCLDMLSGNEEFVLHDNSNNGLTYNELYISEYHEIENDILRIFGYRSDIEFPNDYFFLYHGSPIIKEIDLNTQEVFNIQVGTPPAEPSLYTLFSGANGKQFINKDGEHLHYLVGGKIENAEAVNYVNFYKISDSLVIDSNSLNEIKFNTNIATNELSLTSNPIAHDVNDSLFFIINTVKSLPDLELSPKSASISWWDVSSLNEISKISEIDVTDIFPKQMDPYRFLNFKTFGNDVILTQHIDEFDSETSLNKFSWIHWYNSDTGLVAGIQKFGDNEKNYTHLQPISIQDDALLFFASGEQDSNVSYDIFSLSRNESMADLVGSVSIKKKENISYGRIGDLHNINENLCLGILRYSFLQENGVFTNANVYMAFDFSKILSSNKVVREEPFSSMFDLYPNPIGNQLNVIFDKFRSGSVTILDLNGRTLLIKILRGEQNMSLDVSHLKSGSYVFKYIDISGSSQSLLVQKLR